MAKQPYNNRGWIEWSEPKEPEIDPNLPEVSPKVFREMKQKYEDEGKRVSILGERFYGAVLVVDHVQVAKRIKPEVWESCNSMGLKQSTAMIKESEEINAKNGKVQWNKFSIAAIIIGNLIFFIAMIPVILILTLIVGFIWCCLSIALDFTITTNDVWHNGPISIILDHAEYWIAIAMTVFNYRYYLYLRDENNKRTNPIATLFAFIDEIFSE